MTGNYIIVHKLTCDSHQNTDSVLQNIMKFSAYNEIKLEAYENMVTLIDSFDLSFSHYDLFYHFPILKTCHVAKTVKI